MPAAGQLFLGVNDDEPAATTRAIFQVQVARERRTPLAPVGTRTQGRLLSRDRPCFLTRPVRRAPAAGRAGPDLGCTRIVTIPMADWKDTLNLPAHRLPDEGEPARPPSRRRSRGGRRWGCTSRSASAAARPAAVRAARRAAVRERPDPPRHGDEQDPQGSRRQVAVDDGVRRALRARLRLPRAANRAEGGPRARTEEARHVASPTSAAPAAPTPRASSTS